MNFDLYFREDGPICYETQLLTHERDASSMAKDFLSSNLNWYWMSSRNEDAIKEDKVWNLPKIRPITLLTPENEQLLVRDLLEEDKDCCYGWIFLIAIDKAQTIKTNDELKNSLKVFLEEKSPIRCVINRIEVMDPHYIFVPHNPSSEMQKLLNSWGLYKGSERKTYKYKRLRLAKLECMIDGVVSNAFANKD